MALDIRAGLQRIYPLIFALMFWGILIAPNLKPVVSINTFEANFLGHDQLIEAFNTLRLKLGDRVFPNVIIGKDSWLFYTGTGAIDEFQGSNPYTSDALRAIEHNIDSLNGRLKEKGIMLVVVIPPDKTSVYPEYMPDQIQIIGDKSRLDQFVDFMHMYGKTPVIDLRPALIKASKNEDVFYKTDTHWNPLGQFVAYTQILSVLSQQYPELVPHPLSDYEVVHGGPDTFDMVRILGFPMILENDLTLNPKFNTGANLRLVPLSDGQLIQLSWNQNQHLPSLLTYNDSFMLGIVPFLEPHFRQITAILHTDIPGLWNINWVDQVHPDIVILEYVERTLNSDLMIPGNQ